MPRLVPKAFKSRLTILNVTVMNWEGTEMSYWGAEVRTRIKHADLITKLLKALNHSTHLSLQQSSHGWTYVKPFAGLEVNISRCCGITNCTRQLLGSLWNSGYSFSCLPQLVTSEVCSLAQTMGLVPAASAFMHFILVGKKQAQGVQQGLHSSHCRRQLPLRGELPDSLMAPAWP